MNLLAPNWHDLEMLPRMLAVAMERAAAAHALGLLSEADLYALPDRTTVEIIWGGGNGPHRYDVVHWYGRPYAVSCASHPQRADIGPVGKIDNVGADPTCTWVRLPTSAPWPPRKTVLR